MYNCAFFYLHKGIEDAKNGSKCQLVFTLGPETGDGIGYRRHTSKQVGI